MTEPRPSLARRRHRRMPGPAGGTASRRTGQILLAGTAVVVAVASALGFAAQQRPSTALPPPAAEIPLTPVGSESPVDGRQPSSSGGAGAGPATAPTAPGPAPTTAPATAPQPAAPPGPANPPPTTAAPPTAPPRATTRPPAAPPTATRRPPAAPPAATPRRVGPAGLADFDTFLDGFCEKRGFRGAHLLNGRRTPTTGRWVCTRFTRIETINLDEACRATFGGSSRARPQVDGDIRTVRCFDS